MDPEGDIGPDVAFGGAAGTVQSPDGHSVLPGLLFHHYLLEHLG